MKDNAREQKSNFKLIWNRAGAWSHCRRACRQRKALQCHRSGRRIQCVYKYCSALTSLLSLLIFASTSIPAMQRNLFTEEEVRLATERRLKYLGAAKVSIYQLHFDPPLPRDLDPKNLDWLCEIFHKNCCHCLDVNNHVPVIVSWQDLANALQKANIPQRLLLTNNSHQLP